MKRFSRFLKIRKGKNKEKRKSLDRHVTEWVGSLSEKFDVTELIGKGQSGKVYLATERNENRIVALKKIDITKSLDVRLTAEIDAMKMITHVSIVQLFDIFQTSNHIYLVMEYVAGGDLYDWLLGNSNTGPRRRVSEKQTALIMHQIFSGLEYMHALKIVHRDLKLENVLCTDETKSNPSIKIADFGLSKIVDGHQKLHTQCGSPEYVAPEIIMMNTYDEKVDIWSAGVMTYILMTGWFPFGSTTNNVVIMFEAIRCADYDWDDTKVSEDAREFISMLLRVNSTDRYSARQALQAEWIKSRQAMLE